LENGAIPGVQGMVGGAFQFNGMNQYLATSVPVPTQGTIDLWVKPGILDSIDGIFGTFGLSNGDDRLWLNARGPLGGLAVPPDNLVVNVSNCCVNEIVVPSALVINTWTHLALTFDYVANTYTLYVNGQPVGNFTGPRNLPTQPLEFGTNRSNFGQNFFLSGLVDEVDLFNRILPASEIQAIYTAGSVGKCKTSSQPPTAVCQNVTVNADSSCTATASINNGSQGANGDPVTLTISPEAFSMTAATSDISVQCRKVQPAFSNFWMACR